MFDIAHYMAKVDSPIGDPSKVDFSWHGEGPKIGYENPYRIDTAFNL